MITQQVKHYLQKVRLDRRVLMIAAIGVVMIAPSIALRLQPIVGVYVAAAAFAALLVVALRWQQTRKLAIAAAIWPFTLLAAAVLPQTDAFKQTAVLYDTLLLLALFYEYLFSLDEPAGLSLSGRYYILALPLMIVVGEVLGTLGYGMLRHEYAFHGESLALVATLAVVYAIAEELYFRGLVQHQAAKCVQPIIAAAITAVIYVAANIGQGSGLPIVFALFSGSVLSTVYYFKPSVVLTSVLNASMKLTYFGLLATFVLR